MTKWHMAHVVFCIHCSLAPCKAWPPSKGTGLSGWLPSAHLKEKPLWQATTLPAATRNPELARCPSMLRLLCSGHTSLRVRMWWQAHEQYSSPELLSPAEPQNQRVSASTRGGLENKARGRIGQIASQRLWENTTTSNNDNSQHSASGGQVQGATPRTSPWPKRVEVRRVNSDRIQNGSLYYDYSENSTSFEFSRCKCVKTASLILKCQLRN